MPTQRATFLAFMTSGLLWTVAASWGLGAGVIAVIVAPFVLLGSVVLALVRDRNALVFTVLWGAAVVLFAVLTMPVAGFLAIVVGLVVGTVCFVAWVGTGFLLLHTFGLPRRTVDM